MTYIIPDDFFKKYPKQQGESIIIGNDYVVKVINGSSVESTFEFLIRELNILTRLIHPAIIKLRHWTIDEQYIGYLALDRGSNVNATNRKNILYFMNYLLSALDLMHQSGFCHNDIKLQNIVFIDDKPVFIDFDGSSPVWRYPNTTVIKFPIQTFCYRDPEIYFRELSWISYPIDARTELYSLGMIIEDQQPDLISDLTHYPVINRLTFDQLFDKYQWIKIAGTINDDLSNPNIDLSSKVFSSALIWIREIASQYDYHIQTFFHCLRLFQRTYPKIPSTNVRLLLICCLFISSCSLEDSRMMKFGEMNSLCENKFQQKEVISIIRQILIIHNGLVTTTTPWDCATCQEELNEYFDSLLMNPNAIFQSTNGQNSKFQSCTDWIKGKIQTELNFIPSKHDMEFCFNEFQQLNRDNFEYCYLLTNLYLILVNDPKYRSKIKSILAKEHSEMQKKLFSLVQI